MRVTILGAGAGGEANRRIQAPGSLAHRYDPEDFGHSPLRFMVFAMIAGLDRDEWIAKAGS
jgi:hypothetical protein